MVKFFKFFLFVFLFFASLIYFFPKINGYYLLENELQKYKVVLSDEDVKDRGFSLEIEHANLSFESIQSAHVEKVTVTTLGIYNSLHVEDIRLLDVASSFIPLKVQNIDVRYSIMDPFNILGEAKGEFGELTLKLHVKDQKVSIILNPSKLMLGQYKNTLNYMRKNSKGEYVYEQNIKL